MGFLELQLLTALIFIYRNKLVINDQEYPLDSQRYLLRLCAYVE